MFIRGKESVWREDRDVYLFVDEIHITFGRPFARTFWQLLKRVQQDYGKTANLKVCRYASLFCCVNMYVGPNWVFCV